MATTTQTPTTNMASRHCAGHSLPDHPPTVLPGGRQAAILLMLAYLLSFIDRQILVLMIEPLQRDLGIDDTRFALLHGTSFALFYAFVGLFVGGLIDRYHRVRLIAGAIALWSVATAVCGVTRTYFSLFIARMTVGIGEAAVSPGAYSLLSDYFAPRRRSRAFAVYATGIYLGSGLAFLVGGPLVGYLDSIPDVSLPWFGELASWRLTFIIVGLPGLLLALTFRLLVREPERGIMDRPSPEATGNLSSPGTTSPGMGRFFRFVGQHRAAYACHNIGFGLHMLLSYAMATWLPVILLRSHGWTIAGVGLTIGLQYLIIGPAGTLIGGHIARWLRTRGDHSSELTLGAVSCAMLLAGAIVLVTASGPWVVLGVSAMQIFFMAFPGGLNAASLQIVAPPAYRGQSAALFMLVGNLLGLALGPLLVGAFTDHLFADRAMIDMSLLAVTLLSMPPAILLLVAGRRYFRLAPAPQKGSAA